ncbi:MAG: alanine--tRNA ligase [Candidatus Marinimicrobia bacterium]|jgi:alanyl-tRNA synthetase|nr:alanine--tRNA ligase [Candidatus Neomarinimicrobiota bacterium]MBT3630405.1 alanine--tRNA ligase [Candidatus Neomarinimicrobiota bacterium]MBT3823724.1 alanine--tRNA ligase [Candidatus Neomarinimicrobiota bacterium]MBT4131927.1 alanine--tRNA ligase [Candidatus Neomarinimicrobiota bacterium]MBT4294653.1 alanine--tRNA ligase [Candidatus Neomarinimicrobiota bacterium]
MTSQEIRNQFIQFFKDKNHKFVRSAGVVPFDDPTLLFTNAGMNQFKGIFLETENADHPRAVNSQKCIRVSGKHNDLEEVGRDTYHHTFFEMLGNWSFGDYYKTEAILWAWELFTEVWKIPKDKLYATVYTDDDEAFELWETLTDIPRDHILRFGNKDNFWEMGETGPCGPCSEIHVDIGGDPSIHGSHPELGVNTDNPRFMELWNLVFIQYFRDQKGELTELPKKHVDTGAGLERVVAYLQGKDSNYDTDLFTPILDEISTLSAVGYKSDELGMAHRVIADHVRMLTFSISDGALPSNDGRGYVLRRILRRAARYGRNLGMQEAFIYKLVPIVVTVMGDAYPELRERVAYIQKVIKSEEDSFSQTLGRGLQKFTGMVKDAKAIGETTLSGESVFKLYDTFGFPVDLTSLMAEEQGFGVDLDAFETLMNSQREKARQATQFKQTNTQGSEWEKVESGTHSEFLGYTHPQLDTTITQVMKSDKEFFIILTQTPFYAESGGQVGDTGRIYNANMELEVLDTRNEGDSIIHETKLISGEFNTEPVIAVIDNSRRGNIIRNHSATHLLNAALRKILGDHVKQAGSLVDDNHLRFDFNHFEKMTPEELNQAERLVNAEIRKNTSTSIRNMSFDDAKNEGALAFFGEKYGDDVRTVKFGEYSHELCGGVHVLATGDIGYFRIESEAAIAAGVRRIEAVTGAVAEENARVERSTINHLRHLLTSDVEDLGTKTQHLLDEKKALEKQVKTLSFDQAASVLTDILENTQLIGGVKVLSEVVEVSDTEALKDLGSELVRQMKSGLGVLGTVIDGSPYVVCVVSDDVIAQHKLKAGEIVRILGQQLGGGGGGKPQMATAGGKDATALATVIEGVFDLIGERLG